MGQALNRIIELRENQPNLRNSEIARMVGCNMSYVRHVIKHGNKKWTPEMGLSESERNARACDYLLERLRKHHPLKVLGAPS
jgi:hypothetical protein